MPITIHGKPFRTSSVSFTWSASLRGANSLTQIAAATPIGTEIAAAIRTSMKVPTMGGCDPAPRAGRTRRTWGP